jgi:hypothetical protein
MTYIISNGSFNIHALPSLEHVFVLSCYRLGKLPLTDQNAENTENITGEPDWWDTLEWHSDTTKPSLQPYFTRECENQNIFFF